MRPPDLNRFTALAEQLAASRSLFAVKNRDTLPRYIAIIMLRSLLVAERVDSPRLSADGDVTVTAGVQRRAVRGNALIGLLSRRWMGIVLRVLLSDANWKGPCACIQRGGKVVDSGRGAGRADR